MSENTKDQQEPIEEPQVVAHSAEDSDEELPWCGVCKVANSPN